MRKLSEIKGEEAFDVIAEILEPLAKVLSDKAINDAIMHGKNKLSAAINACKNYKNEIIVILAAIDGKTIEQMKEEITPVSLPKMLMEQINDPELQKLF